MNIEYSVSAVHQETLFPCSTLYAGKEYQIISRVTFPAGPTTTATKGAPPRVLWRQRLLLQAVGARKGSLIAHPLANTTVRTGHETDPGPVTIEFNRAHIARVFDAAEFAAGAVAAAVAFEVLRRHQVTHPP